jgi:hypothetical protein
VYEENFSLTDRAWFLCGLLPISMAGSMTVCEVGALAHEAPKNFAEMQNSRLTDLIPGCSVRAGLVI